jgi:hypothetical protein
MDPDDFLDAIDAETARITDAHIEERLCETLHRAAVSRECAIRYLIDLCDMALIADDELFVAITNPPEEGESPGVTAR